MKQNFSIIFFICFTLLGCESKEDLAQKCANLSDTGKISEAVLVCRKACDLDDGFSCRKLGYFVLGLTT